MTDSRVFSNARTGANVAETCIDPDRRYAPEEALDRTLYWTLSFYLPVERLSLRPGPAKVVPVDPHSARLRDAIEPLFNDIADRSRLGRIEDSLFAAGEPERCRLRMPATVDWTTEGTTFRVRIPEPHRLRDVGLRRFWYVHGNGSLSWHLGFSVHYGTELARDLEDGCPSTYYFLSLLQKLAWPKEFRCTTPATTTDELVGIDVLVLDGKSMPFWEFVRACFERDRGLLGWLHPDLVAEAFDIVVPFVDSIEVPGLRCRDSRSLFFIHDSEFFALIQPKDEDGNLVSRRLRVSDADFRRYPALIARQIRAQRGAEVELDADYWHVVLGEGDANDARRQLACLFLAGFNQNIMDFTNQEASEVLDSLDPIYPASDEQMEEGFFIRYANPRAMITYVPRSRTLEVGNDHIGTCPYAFLIHALSMHNEALTRAQERATFEAIHEIGRLTTIGERDEKNGHRYFEAAEKIINKVRLDAFHTYERHRYINPFRYDTERDVFEELERLRGTSRLKLAYEGALASLDEHNRDLARMRQEKDAERAERHDRLLSVLFGIFGISGVIQVAYQADQFFMRSGELGVTDRLLGILYCAVPLVVGLLIYLHHRLRDR